MRDVDRYGSPVVSQLVYAEVVERAARQAARLMQLESVLRNIASNKLRKLESTDSTPQRMRDIQTGLDIAADMARKGLDSQPSDGAEDG